MHLRSIQLGGFKTFARPTEIRFDAGVTAIVGPNGSGKSNIVDAFKWVLGETQARDLRGRRMEEIIYSGGERRPRASSAEAVIVIDNSSGRLPVDYAEVAIRRRVDRTGQSDYFVNGSRVRRRDVIDLLSSTGLTVDSYSIVGQADIERIINCTPGERRLLIEEAAQVRGVKARRTEAASKLQELAFNLRRLEDLRAEIEPRLESVRAQAGAAREAAEALRRLEVLRGSIAWEEWREARDTHRRAVSQVQSIERRLAEASGLAAEAEEAFRRGRHEMEAAQDRRLQRQRALGTLRLELSKAESDLALARERSRGQAALAEAARAEGEDLAARAEAGAQRKAQVAAELESARSELAAVPAPPPRPEPGDPEAARQARRAAEAARRAAGEAGAALAAERSRRQFLEETVARLTAEVGAAEAALPAAEKSAADARRQAESAAAAASELTRIQAELEGLEALIPEAAGGLQRLGDVLLPDPGYEAALSAVLGPLVEAWAAPDLGAARAGLDPAGAQRTVLYPDRAPQPRPGSLLEHVRCEPGYEALGARLLGGVVVGGEGDPEQAWVTLDGWFHGAGMVRAGSDPRVQLAARRHRLLERGAALRAPAAGVADLAAAQRKADSILAGLRTAAAGRTRLVDASERLAQSRVAEDGLVARAPQLESEAMAAEERAADLARHATEQDGLLAAHAAETRRLDLERLRWSDRIRDLERQLAALDAERESIERAREARIRRAAEAVRLAAEAEGALPGLDAAVAEARRRLEGQEQASPEEEAELAAAARKLVALEESRVDSRLRVSTLEGSLGLLAREAQLAHERMEALRSRMPEGLAPEEIPGGKAREREMRSLERRLEELGPTNPLAESECAELEARHRTLAEQLDDIAAARADLEQLIARLREEEETRYEAVFGAVAANFQEFFAELTAGGKATLRHVGGDEGAMSGVEILVQPPRKRLQNVTLLSSGERSLTAFALVLALEEVNPSPFVILDEVDAALDDANVGRFGSMIQRLGRDRQFLVITHNHMTMACAAALYGVHLDESGASHLVSVRLEEIRGRGIKAATA